LKPMNVANWISTHASHTPDKLALIFEEQRISYAVLACRIQFAVEVLLQTHNVKAGDRIAWQGYNHPDMLVLLFACARIGAMFAPLNWRLTVAEQSYQLKDCGAQLLFTDGCFEQHCVELGEQIAGLKIHQLQSYGEIELPGNKYSETSAQDNPLLLVYSSGTTGHPKGVVLNQAALLANAVMSQHMHDMTAADQILTTLPMFHVGGLNIQTTPAFFCGATVVLQRRFEPEACLRSIEHDKPTLTVLVPATIRALTSHDQWRATYLASLRCVTTGSSVVPIPLIEEFENRQIPVLQVYGSTETCPVAVYQKYAGDDVNHHTTGKAGLLCQIRIANSSGIDVPPGYSGEILVKGDNVMTEYWNDPVETALAFHGVWFRSGDIGHLDSQGRLIIDDRSKDMIVSGGENIYPAELERVLHDHDSVIEAAVIGIADPRWGETPLALIRVSLDVSIDELKSHCAEQLAPFKVPRRFEFVDDFPRNSLGKVQKFILRAGYNCLNPS
jgi:fatty-acyl-CoA synthase